VTTSFLDLGVPPALAARLSARGIDAPFPIQEASIPDAIAGRDVVAKAPTGSGKTLAFGVVAADRCVGARARRPRGLVLEPTRELAAQVRDELTSLRDDGSRRIIAVYGGTRYGPTQQAMSKGVDILVACPGRLEDLIEQGMVDLSEVELLVIDEADRMADMGFMPCVRRIVEQISDERQILLFSATMGKEVESLSSRYQVNPVRHDVTGDVEAAGDVDHHFWAVSRDARLEVCTEAVRQMGSAIVFCRTKRGADRLARQLGANGISAVAIHGDRSQAQRERALRQFEQGQAQALVATDVAARGIHLEALPLVVHYDPPADHTDYTHRSGRTGRAGLDGVVVSLVVEDMRTPVKKLQRALEMPIGFDDPVELIPSPTMPTRSVKAPSRSTNAIDDERATKQGRTRPERAQRARPTDRTDRPRRIERPAARASAGSGTPNGTVKFFDAKRGYGFVERPGEVDLFVHATNLADGPKTILEAGQQVSFDVGSGKKGAEAHNVKVLSRDRNQRPSRGPARTGGSRQVARSGRSR
jgi:superfamily II DNA/RNA helicase